jgi:tetratricopeptide (TPR) repeat protein
MSDERPVDVEKQAISEPDLFAEAQPADVTRDRGVPGLSEIEAEPTAAPIYQDPTRTALDDAALLHVDPEARIRAFVAGGLCVADLYGLPRSELYELAAQAERLFRSGDLAGAEVAFTGLTALMPTCDDFQASLGAVFHRQRRLEEAQRAYSRCLALNALHVVARVNRAELLLELGDLDAALEDLTLARRADPEGKDPHSERTQAVTLALVNLVAEFAEPNS